MSSQDLGLLVKSLAHGLQDSLLGIRTLIRMEQEDARIAQEIASRTRSSPQPPTELQRRRAERNSGERVKRQAKDEPPKIRRRILQCCLLNGGVFLASIFMFNHLLLPILENVTHMLLGHTEGVRVQVWWWLSLLTSWLFKCLWILPLFVLSRIVSFIWFQDIADAAWDRSTQHRKHLPFSSKSSLRSSFGTLVADLLFSLLIQTLFLCQAQLASILPIPALAQSLSVLHISLLNALYAFEYKWFNLGWEIHRRLRFVETRWSYFMGFGLPLALATVWFDSYWINGCIFSVLFPLLIVSANEAAPVTQETPLKLPLFTLVVIICNYIVGRSVTRAELRAKNVTKDLQEATAASQSRN